MTSLLLATPAAGPGCFIQRAKHQHGGLANRRELLDQPGQSAVAERSILHVIILLKAGQRSLVVAGNAHRPVAEDAFGVNDVPERFLHTPLSRGVTEISVGLRARQQGQRGRQLLFQRGENVAVRHQGNVLVVVGSVLVRLGSGGDQLTGFHKYSPLECRFRIPEFVVEGLEAWKLGPRTSEPQTPQTILRTLRTLRSKLSLIAN